ncbi:MAG: M48 family metallopeptidase [Bacteroidales bacterium]|nr:M48 family metallopeptidase [Bacteroidales bacterium]
MTDKIFPNIGIVHFNKKKGCRKVIVKVLQNGETYVSVPWLYPIKLAEIFVLKNTEWINNQQNKRKNSQKLITQSQEKFTHFHDLEIVTGIDNSFRISTRNGVIKAIIPQTINVEDPRIQDELIKTVEIVLRKEAKIFIPERVKLLSQEHGFSYSSIKISSAKTRWGCCNSQKRIVFSLYLMTLPFHLIDYVILHELCHTVFMNHSKDFYALLDKCCGGKHSTYKNEIKKFPMDVFPKFTKDNL